MQKLILIGGGGHCKVCIDIIEQTGQYHIAGILDAANLIGTEVLGYKIIGTDEDIWKYAGQDYQFLITVGQIKTATVRKKIYQLLKEQNCTLATVFSPKATVSSYARIGEGTIIMHHAIVNAAAEIGVNCILNTGCDIEHDVIVGQHTHISTYAVINGGSHIGKETFIGSNATVSNQISLTDQVIIGSGAVVHRNIAAPGTYAGNPVKKIN